MQTQFIVPGHSKIRAEVLCKRVDFFEKKVGILPKREPNVHWLRYFGPPMHWGAERHALFDIAPLVAQLAESVEVEGRAVSIAESLQPRAAFWDLNGRASVTEQQLSKRLKEVEYLGSTPPAMRAVIKEEGQDRRAVFKSPEMEKGRIIVPTQVLQRLRENTLIIDHLGSAELAITLALHARRIIANLAGFSARGQAQIAIMSDLSVCTLAEFQNMAAAVGILPPGHGREPKLKEVACSMRSFQKKAPVADLVVTLGSHGVLALSKRGRVVIHFAPNFSLRQCERLSLFGRSFGSAIFTTKRFFVGMIQTWEPGDLAGAVICAMTLAINGVDRNLEFRASQMQARLFA